MVLVELRYVGPLLLTLAGCSFGPAQFSHGFELRLPTPNRALYEAEGDVAFYQPTVEGTIASGMFGCVRRDGRRFHEGIDIRCLERDRGGEPIDPVSAVAAGRVAFINHKAGQSNYGRYLVLEHRWDGVPVFSLYAHLRAVADGLAVGHPVQAGQRLGTLGRSTNTREGISRDRAHLHFEIGFLLNPEFDRWYRPQHRKAPRFGMFNGQNFYGIDPARLYGAFAAEPGLRFDQYLWSHPLGFTVLVPADRLPWLARDRSRLAGDDRAATAYEVGVTAWGTPLHAWPRTADQVGAGPLPRLNLVNPDVLGVTNCRGLVRPRGQWAEWELTADGRKWLELLTFVP